MTVSGMDKIKDFQNIVLTSNQSIFGNITPLRLQFKNNSENQEKKKDNKQVIDFFLEYPILAYIEEDQKSISLCNLLRPELPQQQINLNTHLIKKFVGGSNMYSRYQTRSLDTNLTMLVTKVG